MVTSTQALSKSSGTINEDKPDLALHLQVSTKYARIPKHMLWSLSAFLEKRSLNRPLGHNIYYYYYIE